MRSLKRVLALLTALAMLLASAALSEEAIASEPVEEPAIEESIPTEAAEEPAVKEAAEAPVEEVPEEPAEEVAEEPAEEATEEPTEESTEEPADEAEIPAKEPAEESEQGEGAEPEDEALGYIPPENRCEDGMRHSFDWLTGKCEYCGAECPHTNTKVEYLWREDGYEYPYEIYCEYVDEEHHAVYLKYNCIVTTCLDCKFTVKRTRAKGKIRMVEEHVFLSDSESPDNEDRNLCEACDYRRDCDHAHQSKVPQYMPDPRECEVMEDGVHHKESGTYYPNAMVCDDCGLVCDYGEGEPYADRVVEHTMVYDTYSDNIKDDAYFLWGFCAYCGYDDSGDYGAYFDEEPGHEHQWQAVNETQSYYEKVDGDYAHHQRIDVISTGKRCEICGITDVTQEIKPTVEEAHDWAGYHCKTCGMETVCQHEKTVVNRSVTAEEKCKMEGLSVEVASRYVPFDAESHMITTPMYDVVECAYCHETVEFRLCEGKMTAEPHEYKKGTCVKCGYKCKHEDIRMDGRYYMCKFTDITETTHRVTPETKALKYAVCEHCGRKMSSEGKAYQSWVEPHKFTWDFDEERLSCECGYTPECKHTGEIEPRYTFDYIENIENRNDPSVHYVRGSIQVDMICKECGMQAITRDYDDYYDYYCQGLTYPRQVSVVAVPHEMENGVCKACGYTDESKVTGALTLSVRPKLKLGTKEEYVLRAEVYPESARKYVKYESKQPKIFTVDAAGKITAKKAGSGKLVVRCGELTATCKVTVASKMVTKLLLPEEMDWCVGESFMIEPTFRPAKSYANVSWKIDDSGVVSGDMKGNFKMEKPGVAKVTATIYAGTANELSATMTLNVQKAPAKVDVSKVPTTLKLKKNAAIGAVALDEDGKECPVGLTVYSSDKKVVTVNKNGKLVPKGKGKAKLTFIAFNGVFETVEVTVKK